MSLSMANTTLHCDIVYYHSPFSSMYVGTLALENESNLQNGKYLSSQKFLTHALTMFCTCIDIYSVFPLTGSTDAS